MRSSEPSPAWFRRSFNEDYLIIYSGRDRAQAETEVEAIVRELGIGRSEAVLDLCCGFGRHLEALARRGIAAVGVDLSPSLLRQIPPTARGNVVCADMRRLPFAGGERGFAVLLNLFTSFGYFETDAENAAAAREMGRVLRPGGRFAIDLLNAAPTVRALETRSERRAGGFHIREERRHEAARRRLEKRVVLTRLESGETKEYHESVRLYRPEEIDAVLAAAGLRVERLLGDFSGSPYSEDAPRMLLLGRRA